MLFLPSSHIIRPSPISQSYSQCPSMVRQHSVSHIHSVHIIFSNTPLVWLGICCLFIEKKRYTLLIICTVGKKNILPGRAHWNKLIDNQWDFYDKFSKWPWLTHYKSVFISFFPLQSLLFVWIRSMVRIGLYRSLRFFPAWHTQDVRVPSHNHSVSLVTHSILSQIP